MCYVCFVIVCCVNKLLFLRMNVLIVDRSCGNFFFLMYKVDKYSVGSGYLEMNFLVIWYIVEYWVLVISVVYLC